MEVAHSPEIQISLLWSPVRLIADFICYKLTGLLKLNVLSETLHNDSNGLRLASNPTDSSSIMQ